MVMVSGWMPMTRPCYRLLSQLVYVLTPRDVGRGENGNVWWEGAEVKQVLN